VAAALASGVPARQRPTPAQCRAKVRNNRWAGELGRETFHQPCPFWKARGRGKRPKAGAWRFSCRRQLRAETWQRKQLLAVRPQWPQKDGVLKLVFGVGLRAGLRFAPDPSPSRRRRWAGRRAPGKTAVDSAVGRSWEIMASKPLRCGVMATALPLGGFLGPDRTAHSIGVRHLGLGQPVFLWG